MRYADRGCARLRQPVGRVPVRGATAVDGQPADERGAEKSVPKPAATFSLNEHPGRQSLVEHRERVSFGQVAEDFELVRIHVARHHHDRLERSAGRPWKSRQPALNHLEELAGDLQRFLRSSRGRKLLGEEMVPPRERVDGVERHLRKVPSSS